MDASGGDGGVMMDHTPGAMDKRFVGYVNVRMDNCLVMLDIK